MSSVTASVMPVSHLSARLLGGDTLVGCGDRDRLVGDRDGPAGCEDCDGPASLDGDRDCLEGERDCDWRMGGGERDSF